MAITFRETKGSPLTHIELDQNFKEFFFSSSYIGEPARPYGVTLFQSKSLNSGTDIYFPQAIGNNYQIQIKSGSSNISSSFLTGSSNFQFDYDNNHLSISGSGQLSGDLVILGTVTAQEFKSELVSSSILFDSGSSLFGNTPDDTHTFTGSVRVSNGITGSLLSTNGVLSSSAQIATDISGSSTSLSSSLAIDIATNTATSSSITSRVTTNESSITSINTIVDGLNSVSGAYLLNTTDTLNGNLTVTGTLTAQEFNTEYITSSVILESGSTKFGDTADDTHSFTGSLKLLGSSSITGSSSQSGSNFTIKIPAPSNEVVSPSGYGSKYFLDYKNVDSITPDWNGMRIWAYNTTGSRAFDNRLSMRKCYSVGGTAQYWSEIYNSGYELGLGMKSISGSAGFNSLITETDGSVTANISGSLIKLDAPSVQVTGSITVSGDITAFHTSDQRLKDNVTPIEGAVDKVKQIEGYEFDWNSLSEHSGHDIGVIAQEIEKVLPELVVNRQDGYKAVRYDKIVALLINAIKEQQLQIDELKSEL